MSSCLSGGGGRTYNLDLDIVKSPSSSTRTTSSSPSSTLSESTDSPIKISTRKPRTPRKRPNQTYNEAAALLSTVYPNIFSVKNLKKTFKHSKPYGSFSEESSELLPPFQTFGTAEFLIHPPIPERPITRIESKPVSSSENPCQSPEFLSNSYSSNPYEMVEDDFDAESILDEEMEESIGIDSIMGNLSVNVNTIDSFEQFNNGLFFNFNINNPNYYGRFGFGGKFDFGVGGVSAFRQVDNGDWWRFPAVNVLNISPKLNIKTSSEKKKKKKKKDKKKREVEEEEEKETEMEIDIEKGEEEENEEKLENLDLVKGEKNSGSKLSLGLKLNYEDVLVAWSDRGLPFSDDIFGTELSESDAIARLGQIDLFGENGVREASVLRYREKRRSRLFSKKIRYQVRKVNADRRPRMKGRFVRRPPTTRDEEKYKK